MSDVTAQALLSFGMDASLPALLARVAGGIYTIGPEP